MGRYHWYLWYQALHFNDRIVHFGILFLWHFIMVGFSKEVRKMLMSTGPEWAQIWWSQNAWSIHPRCSLASQVRHYLLSSSLPDCKSRFDTHCGQKTGLVYCPAPGSSDQMQGCLIVPLNGLDYIICISHDPLYHFLTIPFSAYPSFSSFWSPSRKTTSLQLLLPLWSQSCYIHT